MHICQILVIVVFIYFFSTALIVDVGVSDLQNLPKFDLAKGAQGSQCTAKPNDIPLYAYPNESISNYVLRLTNSCASWHSSLWHQQDHHHACPSFWNLDTVDEFNSLHDPCDLCYTHNVTNFLLQHDKSDHGTIHTAITIDKQTNMMRTGSSLGDSKPKYFSQYFLRAWFEPLGLHSLPSSLNLANTAVLRSIINDSAATIHAYNHPLNTSIDTQLLDFIESGTDATVAIFIIFALSFIPASVLVFVVTERVTRNKFLQLSSGCAPWTYWTTTYIWDLFCYTVTVSLCIFVLSLFNVDGYAGRNISGISCILLLYGPACISLMYLFSFYFTEPATAYVTMVVANMFLGITTTLSTFILDRFPWHEDLTNANSVLKKMFLIFPNYCLGRGLLNIATNEYTTQYAEIQALIYQDASPTFQKPLTWDIAGRSMFSLIIQSILFFGLTILMDYPAAVRFCKSFIFVFWENITQRIRTRVWAWRRREYSYTLLHRQSTNISNVFAEQSEDFNRRCSGVTLSDTSSMTTVAECNKLEWDQRITDSSRDIHHENDGDKFLERNLDFDNSSNHNSKASSSKEKSIELQLIPAPLMSTCNYESDNDEEAGVDHGIARDISALTAEEEELELDPDSYAIRVQEVCKKYQQSKGKLAVDHVSFGVKHGECFGLLGVNGAGKTTTFKIVAGEHAATSGEVSIGNIVLHSQQSLVSLGVGYCPQEDALLPLLTPYEHMHLIGSLRRTHGIDLQRNIDQLLQLLGLNEWKDTPAYALSGGTKRKLSLALALLGAKSAILLDEPSAGMDAHSKRFMWSRIQDIVKSGRSVLLTSHSMEECEAICSRLTIMVDGRLQCIGSPQVISKSCITVVIKKGDYFPKSLPLLYRFY